MAARTPTVSSNATTAVTPTSSFTRAVDEYIDSRPKKSKTPGFIKDLQQRRDAGEKLDQNAVKQAMVQLEKDTSDRKSAQLVRKSLNPVIRCLSDYASVVDTLAQADPMPTALIWGCLKAVIQASERFLELYTKIKDQLTNLNTHIEVLIMYEDLFGHSSTMQELLQASYIHIIRFWHRVEKECRRYVTNRLARATFSFSTSKLDGVIGDIEKNADRITLLVPAVQERIANGEREDAAEERRLAGLAREEQKALFQLTAAELKIRNEERKKTRKQEVGKWLLSGASHLNESNHRHQERNSSLRSSETCKWLWKTDKFLNWFDPDNDDASTLWVNATPGAGKSVLTAYAIEQARSRVSATSAVCYQYYTFDEEFSCIQVLRSLTEQLANRLWEQTEDMPEEIHDLTMKSTTSSNSEDVRAVLRMLLARMSRTYIFLDGLDEECDNGRRWGHLTQFLDCILEIVKEGTLKVKLWCSSQLRTCMEGRLQKFSTIQITQELNTNDIRSYLKAKIPDLDNLELDEGYRNMILKDLSSQADGCFLWASLMLDSITRASSLQDIHQHINEGLPGDYENYYKDKMQSVDPANRRLVSVLLACIVYSMRPLRLDELCEATAAIAVEEGKDIDRSAKLFRSKVIALCQPLVQIQNSETDHGTVSTCTLTHATVRSFLLKHTYVLGDNYPIFAGTMADVCLKYLMQPRYNSLLKRAGNDFWDKRDENILDHHLLVYVAKYWDKHLDIVEYSPELLKRVVRFIKSRQYFTCLQVQSLLVGGQFSFWYDASHVWLGPHIKRVFPRWLHEHCEEELEQAYRLFVSDWGLYLDQYAGVSGTNPGELQRCFFGALGRQNFLSGGPSLYTSFTLRSTSSSAENELPTRFFDAVNNEGTEVVVLSLKELHKDISELEVMCEIWNIEGISPALQQSQLLRTSNETIWALYDYPAAQKAVGRPSPVAVTSDLQVLRIGSQIFSKDENHQYQPVKGLNFEETYIDELASRGHSIAITSRRNMTYNDLYQPENKVPGHLVDDHGEALARQMHLLEAVNRVEQVTASSASKTATGDSKDSDSDSDVASSHTSVSSEQDLDSAYLGSLPIKLENLVNLAGTIRIGKDETALAKEMEDDEEFFETESESDGNSAEEEWSEGSSEMEDDELEDEDQWNDWGNERLTFEELEVDAAERSSASSESGSDVPQYDLADLQDSDTESRKSSDEDLDIKDQYSSDDEDQKSIDSHYTLSNYSNYSDSEANDSDVENAQHLDAIIFGKGDKSESARKTTIQVYDLAQEGKTREPVFHFTRSVRGGIFNSPPAFHPSRPLLVWPLGDGEILFADYKKNTYFTRYLCCSRYKSCHVFIKTHFSTTGEYVHFAALEAGERDTKAGGGLSLILQVSTHRLSVAKTTGSPPRLLYKATVSLGHCQSLHVSNLPYTLHWTESELFVTKRGQELEVIRIPLFRDSENEKQKVCYVQSKIFLPRTTDERTVYFFPPSAPAALPELSPKEDTSKPARTTPNPAHVFSTTRNPQSKKPKVKVDRSTHATVIIGSHSSIPSQGLLVPRYQVAPPLGVFLHEEKDLGGWACKPLPEEEKGLRRRGEGGRLQGRFESFDRREDCDIVPFLY